MNLRQNLLLASKSPGVDIPFDDVKYTWLKGSLRFRKFPTWNIFNLVTDQKPFFTQCYDQYTTCEHKRNSIDDSNCGFCLCGLCCKSAEQ